jgi:hypothetical protein
MSGRHGVFGALGLMVAAATVFLVRPAAASQVWDGDASQGTRVFGNLNCDKPGSVTAVDDPTEGRVWRFSKPSGSNRCENHGIAIDGKRYAFKNGSTYYMGWRSKLTSLVNNNANFQWKSYGNHIQNFPVVIKMVGQKATMIQTQPHTSSKTIWSESVSANTWVSYVVGLHLSDATTGGWVELYVNGVQQTFSNGSRRYACRTWDSSNEPKWGVYGASGTSVTNYVDGLKVGTAYGDVR